MTDQKGWGSYLPDHDLIAGVGLVGPEGYIGMRIGGEGRKSISKMTTSLFLFG